MFAPRHGRVGHLLCPLSCPERTRKAADGRRRGPGDALRFRGRQSGWRGRPVHPRPECGIAVALALFSATALPLVVVITGIGTAAGRMLPSNAAALVGAAMMSVLLYPLIGFSLRRRAEGKQGATSDGDGDGAGTHPGDDPSADDDLLDQIGTE